MTAVKIHPTSLVEKGAELDEGVEVGPFCLIGPQAKIGKNTKLSSHVRIEADVTMGADNLIDSHACFGGEPQDLAYKGEETSLLIGDRNRFREGFCAHRGSVGGDGVTRIGSDNYMMGNVHVAHDCVIGNHVIMVQMSGLPGHVHLKDHCFLGGSSSALQGTRIGRFAFLAGYCRMHRDLPPFMAARDASHVVGPNLVGLKRAGFDSTQLRCVKNIYKIFFNKKIAMKEALLKIEHELGEHAEAKEFVAFVRETKIGVQR